jgi:hypothetical protein
LRKLHVDEPVQAQQSTGQEDIARIVKETISTLNIGDERARKQRDDIVRALFITAVGTASIFFCI